MPADVSKFPPQVSVYDCGRSVPELVALPATARLAPKVRAPVVILSDFIVAAVPNNGLCVELGIVTSLSMPGTTLFVQLDAVAQSVVAAVADHVNPPNVQLVLLPELIVESAGAIAVELVLFESFTSE